MNHPHLVILRACLNLSNPASVQALVSNAAAPLDYTINRRRLAIPRVLSSAEQQFTTKQSVSPVAHF